MDERRSAPRWEINKEAGLTVDGGVKPIPCLVEDISTGGMRVSMHRNLFPEVFSNFNLALSDNFSLDLNAHVAWQDQRRDRNIFGLVFNQAEEPLKLRINEYVKNSFPEVMAKQWWGGM